MHVTPNNSGYAYFTFVSAFPDEFLSIYERIKSRVDVKPPSIIAYSVVQMGAVTACILQTSYSHSTEIVGISRCSPNDEFNRDIGRKLAISRAIRRLFEHPKGIQL